MMDFVEEYLLHDLEAYNCAFRNHSEHICEATKLRFVNYLESTGTLYIDTGYKPNLNTRIVIKYGCKFGSYVCAAKSSGLNHYFGITNSSDTELIHCRINSAIMNTETCHFTEGDIYTIDFDRTKCIVNGVSVYNTEASITDYTSPHNLYLFTVNNNGTAYTGLYGKNIIYSVDIYDGETLVRSFRPCIYEGKIGMWDLVSKTLYENKGTGEFIVGNN